MPPRETYLLDRAGELLQGRYRVTQLLGAGSMGSVWLAEHIALRRTVVVKFHEAGFTGVGGDLAEARFLREARTLSAVRHRNVNELFEVGATDAGELYLVLERLRGETLAARMRSEVIFGEEFSVAVALAVASGLEAVHAAGVLHRDVKPENLLLHEEGTELVPKLIDFGLARGVEGGERLTRTHGAVGTPGYMSPEQSRGSADLDARVDLYALGVVLYEMLTGNLPAEGETATELLVWTSSRDPIPITDRRPTVSPRLAEAVMKLLERERDARPASVREARSMLLDAVSESGRSLPPLRVGRVSRRVRRTRDPRTPPDLVRALVQTPAKATSRPTLPGCRDDD